MRTRELSDYEAANAALADVVKGAISQMSAPAVLEAGGGSLSRVRVPTDSYITVIDISLEQLDRNKYAHQKVLGDLHSHELPDDSFDVIVCWNVLEHLDRPDEVLVSFAKWSRPGSVIILAAPNPLSLSGLITKYTPHGFHVWVMKRIFKWPDAGKPGYPPFPAPMRPAMHPGAIHRIFDDAGFTLLHSRAYGSRRAELLREKSPRVGALFQGTLRLLGLLSMGRWHPENSDFHMVAQKPGKGDAHASSRSGAED